MQRLGEYDALVAKVDAFARSVFERRPEDLSCRPGCTACCEVRLTVSPVEAAAIAAHLRTLAPEARRALAQRGNRSADEGACAMLDGRGRCAIYEARPLVCRTQGLPLLYALNREDREATCCSLNFTEQTPAPEDVLDADRVNQLLAVVNLRFVGGGGDPHARIALAALAREASLG